MVDGGGQKRASLGVVVIINGMVTMTYGQFLGDNLTNNIAELHAIWKGLRLVKHLKRPIRIYSDSHYAIRSICQEYNGKRNRVLIDNIIKYIKQYPTQIEFVKVKGHSGIKFNEYADSIAGWFLKEESQNGNYKQKKKKNKN